MIKVLFVCLANICRSPMAEGLFKDFVKRKGLEDKFHFESRAISKWENQPVHEKTVEKLEPLTVDMRKKSSKQITERDFIEYDYIIGMDKMNLNYLKSFEDGYYQNKVYPYIKRKNIPDPFFTGDFDKTYKMLSKKVESWVNKILKEEEIESNQ